MVARKAATTYKSDIVLGERYRDTITGFVGTATSAAFFLHACERILLEHLDPGTFEMRELVLDAPRLVHVESEKPARTTRTGGVRPSPGQSKGAMR